MKISERIRPRERGLSLGFYLLAVISINKDGVLTRSYRNTKYVCLLLPENGIYHYFKNSVFLRIPEKYPERRINIILPDSRGKSTHRSNRCDTANLLCINKEIMTFNLSTGKSSVHYAAECRENGLFVQNLKRV